MTGRRLVEQGKMNQKSQLEAGLKVGDRVRLVAETLSWRAEKTLQGQIAEVIELRENGRVSVRFDNGRLLMGRDTGSFEHVAGPGLNPNAARQTISDGQRSLNISN